VALDIVPLQVEDASPALSAVGLAVHAEAIVGIAGHARAGKTRLAAAVAERFGDASVVGFGDAVRGRARIARRVVDSDVLIEIGTNWVQRDPLGFCREVLKQQLEPSRLLLVEGIHHEVIRDALTDLVAPVPIRFVILKTPDREIIDRFQGEGKTAEQAARVLSDSTEIDVDRALLAKADLVLDGTHPVADNVDRVITLVQQLSGSSGPATTIVGGLDRQQRSELVEAVAKEFKWLLPAEVAEDLGISIQQVGRLREQRELLGLQINGSLLYPSFTIVGHQPNPAVAIVLRLLSPVMSDWELVAWLMAVNGYLDGARPIDQPAEQIQVAVDAELSHG
jgi:hypothetical protein